MTAPADAKFIVPPGAVTLTTWGSITIETYQSLLEMRSFSEAQGLRNIAWTFIPGALVDRARNEAVARFLEHRPALDWLLFVDGDCTFAPDALTRLLQFAYADAPFADAVGAYCNLRNEPYMPTIDTGTGTWEPHLPGVGPIEVMRTGSAFILLKRRVFEALPGPWYGTRHAMRPIDALAEVDNFAHQRFDGRNPLARYPEWASLLRCARDDASTFQPASPAAFVGEDSGLCDRMKAAGMRIFVQTDVATGHVDRMIATATEHRQAMQRREKNRSLLVGVSQ